METLGLLLQQVGVGWGGGQGCSHADADAEMQHRRRGHWNALSLESKLVRSGR
jgi:hypothetical protein